MTTETKKKVAGSRVVKDTKNTISARKCETTVLSDRASRTCPWLSLSGAIHGRPDAKVAPLTIDHICRGCKRHGLKRTVGKGSVAWKNKQTQRVA